MSDPNYMKERLLISELAKGQLKSHDLQMTLIHRLMEKNGWSFPTCEEDSSDYGIAVADVEWFIEQLISLS